MLQTLSPVILKLLLSLMTAVATHLVMSFGQTLLHYKRLQRDQSNQPNNGAQCCWTI